MHVLRFISCIYVFGTRCVSVLGAQIITFGRSRTLGRFENIVKEGSCLERLGLVKTRKDAMYV